MERVVRRIRYGRVFAAWCRARRGDRPHRGEGAERSRRLRADAERRPHRDRAALSGARGRLPTVVPVVGRRDADRADVAAAAAAAADEGVGQRRLRAVAGALRGRADSPSSSSAPRADSCERAILMLKERYPDDRDHRLRRLVLRPRARPGHRGRTRCTALVPRGARIIICSLPPAKQVLLSQFMWEYAPAVGVATGGALSFFVGDVKRAPVWVSRLSFEWLWRLAARAGAAVAALPDRGRRGAARLRRHGPRPAGRAIAHRRRRRARSPGCRTTPPVPPEPRQRRRRIGRRPPRQREPSQQLASQAGRGRQRRAPGPGRRCAKRRSGSTRSRTAMNRSHWS